jgi:SAM-dependent methyltransferase
MLQWLQLSIGSGEQSKMPASIQEVREYWNTRPCNIRHGQSAVGSRNWSAEVTVRKYFVEPHIPAFADFPRWKDKRVLEIGCGIGTDMLEFRQAGAILHLAWQRAYLLGIRDGITFHYFDAEWELPVGPFDLVYSFGVLHHTPTPERVLVRAYDHLKQGGELRIMLYAKWSIKRFLRRQPEAQAGCPIARTYTIEAARKLVEQCGFEVSSIEKTHIFPYRIKEYVQHEYLKHWYYQFMPARLFAALEHFFGEHLLICARKA